MESRQGQYHGGKQITLGVQHKMEGCAEARKNIPPTRVFCKPTEDKGQVSDEFLLHSYRSLRNTTSEKLNIKLAIKRSKISIQRPRSSHGKGFIRTEPRKLCSCKSEHRGDVRNGNIQTAETED